MILGMDTNFLPLKQSLKPQPDWHVQFVNEYQLLEQELTQQIGGRGVIKQREKREEDELSLSSTVSHIGFVY